MEPFGDYAVLSHHEYPECSLRVLRLAPGQESAEHTHRGSMQCYLVLEGRAEVRVDEAFHQLETGEAVRVPVGAIHALQPLSGPATVLSVSVPPLRADDHLPAEAERGLSFRGRAQSSS